MNVYPATVTVALLPTNTTLTYRPPIVLYNDGTTDLLSATRLIVPSAHSTHRGLPLYRYDYGGLQLRSVGDSARLRPSTSIVCFNV